MSIELRQRLKELEAKVQAHFKSQNQQQPAACSCDLRLKDLENKYRMLNARLNKKNNKDDRDRDPGAT